MNDSLFVITSLISTPFLLIFSDLQTGQEIIEGLYQKVRQRRESEYLDYWGNLIEVFINQTKYQRRKLNVYNLLLQAREALNLDPNTSGGWGEVKEVRKMIPYSVNVVAHTESDGESGGAAYHVPVGRSSEFLGYYITRDASEIINYAFADPGGPMRQIIFIGYVDTALVASGLSSKTKDYDSRRGKWKNIKVTDEDLLGRVGHITNQGSDAISTNFYPPILPKTNLDIEDWLTNRAIRLKRAKRFGMSFDQRINLFYSGH